MEVVSLITCRVANCSFEKAVRGRFKPLTQVHSIDFGVSVNRLGRQNQRSTVAYSR